MNIILNILIDFINWFCFTNLYGIENNLSFIFLLIKFFSKAKISFFVKKYIIFFLNYL